MTITIEERLTAAEKNLNRLLEEIQVAITVDEASKHVDIIDTENDDILYRIKRIENVIQRIKYQIQQMSNRKI
jgi:uncharacterized protein YoxC